LIRPEYEGSGMTIPLLPESPEVLRRMYLLYRDYFDRAEKKRRWSVKDSIPWDCCNRALDPAVADVVHTFCMVELYLPDYVGKLIPQVRTNRGRAWMIANWGYEESKHSMALGDWLLHSGQRTDAEMADIEEGVFRHEWQLPYDNARAMVCYTTLQELATWLHYRNLRRIVGGRCPALDRVLQLIAIDERAHYDFFRKVVALYLEHDRPGTLEQLRRVLNTFQMPALHMFAESSRRAAAVKELRIFDEDIFLYEVYEPVLAALGVHKSELRRRNSPREVITTGIRS
jgi:acyl-[acyl-carrier-protein] desaturase